MQTDPSGQSVTTPGSSFSVRVGSATGQVVATITTDQTGTAVAASLNPATYCVEQTAVPNGYQLAPAYSPSACVFVVADPTRGQNPTTVTVTDPSAASPTPTGSAAAGSAAATPTPTPTPGRAPQRTTSGQTARGLLSAATLSRALIGLGVLLLLVGGALVLLARRRRHSNQPYEPPDYQYRSTIN